MARRFTEKELLEGLDPSTGHADELAQLTPRELNAPDNGLEPCRYSDEPTDSSQFWETAALWECLGPEFQNMDAVDALSIPGREEQALSQLVGLGFTLQNLADALGAPVSAIADTQEKAALEPGMRERLVRLLAALSWAEDLFEGDTRAAVRWMTSPAKALGGELPLSMTGSNEALETVGDVIGRIEYGIVQ